MSAEEKLVLLGSGGRSAEFPLAGAAMALGSDAGCDIRPSDGGLLPRHATLEREPGGWRIRATDPARPIESGGRLVMEMRLEHGTVFQLAGCRFRFATARAAVAGGGAAGVEGFADAAHAVGRLAEARRRIAREIGKVIVGQHAVLAQVMVALFARGHCLLIGVPGLAKTLMVRALAGTLDLGAKRIQFTPDLMPADITGADVLEEDPATGRRLFRFNRGPLFANVLLADEINRTPPKTQAALLEAMQEQRVTVNGLAYDLPQPFLVLATQNPIELEGTYPLPEAQLDRFMFSIRVDYPSEAEEQQIVLETTRDADWEVERVLAAEDILRFQRLVRQIPVSRHVAAYATALARATRPGEPQSPDFINQWVRWGAGPRAGQCLLLAAKAHVLLDGRTDVACEDVRAYALPVLRHRTFRNFAAVSEGVSADDIVRRVLEHVKEPDY